MARLPNSTEERKELIPDGERIDIFFKTSHGERYEVDDRRPRDKRPGGMKKEQYHVHYDATYAAWKRVSDIQKQYQYIEEDVHFGGEDMAKLFEPTFSSNLINRLDEPSFTEFWSASLKAGLDKLNEEIKKANKGIRDSLDLSRK